MLRTATTSLLRGSLSAGPSSLRPVIASTASPLPSRLVANTQRRPLELSCRPFSSSLTMRLGEQGGNDASSSAPTSTTTQTTTADWSRVHEAMNSEGGGGGTTDKKVELQETPMVVLSPAQRLEQQEKAWSRRSLHGDDPVTPYTGRTLEVNQKNPVSQAYKRLLTLLRRNEVRTQLKLAERYEKPNQERRRKKSQRHRARFADMIRKKVQLVSTTKKSSTRQKGIAFVS